MKSLFMGALLVAQTAYAVEKSEPDAAVSSAAAEETQLEEILVLASRDKRDISLVETLNIAPDTGVLLKKTVGANLVNNGPLTGIAQYRGMSRMRVATHIDGAVISPGGPNWMDPPLSYAPAATVETLEVFRGIAPVSAGQETIGGVVNASNWRGNFSEQGATVQGRFRTGAQSVDEGTLLSAGVSIANESHRLSATGFTEQANDADFAHGSITPSHYERDRFDLGYGFRSGANTFELTFGRNNTGDAGTPALPMDIQYIDADLYGAIHRFDGERVQLSSNVYYSDIDHGMTNYELRAAPADASRYRRNITDAKNLGFTSKLSVGQWHFGVDAHTVKHNSNVDNPNNAMFFVVNFNDAQRDSYGVFAERQLNFSDRWLLDLGLRYNHVATNAGEVDATPAVMGMAPAVALRDNFNGADRSIRDDNVDWVAKLNFLVDDRLSYYVGVARKSRSPSYQERYLWLPLQATAGLADGQTYTGNVDLDPEVAHEAELGFDWDSGAFRISPRVFYRYVNDYIQGTPSTNQAAIMFVRMMNAMNGTSNPDPLEFTNVDARFYGLDLDWRYQINDRWALGGIVNYVRGERDDNNDNLYRVAPLNAVVALDYSRSRWGVTVETFAYADQDEVSEVNAETKSDGYLLANAKGYVWVTEGSRLAFGVDNLTDNNYADHLAGVNRAGGNPDVAVGQRLPGYGRSYFVRLDVTLN